MGSKEGRTWIVNAFVFFLPVLFLWIIISLWVSSSLGAHIRFLDNIRTSLLADYSPDYFNKSFKSLKLAIFGEVLSDSNPPAGGMAGLEMALQGLVPTATLSSAGLELTLTPEFHPSTEPFEDTNPTPTIITTSTPEKKSESTQTPIQTPTVKANSTATATPFATATATATEFAPTATPIREKVEPILECVKDNMDGTLTAFFGYKNHNDYAVEIPIGEQNKFDPGPFDRGQPTKYEPGRSNEYPNASFQVDFSEEAISWILDGKTVTASAESKNCDPFIPEGTKDTEDPQLSGGDLNPSPGDLEMCSITITIENLRVIDPAVSSGIAWVKLKYNVEGYTSDYIYSNPLTLCSGGWTEEGGWDGCYSGSIVIKIDPSWIPANSSTNFKINLYAKASDNEGHQICYPLGQYTMPACCGTCE